MHMCSLLTVRRSALMSVLSLSANPLGTLGSCDRWWFAALVVMLLARAQMTLMECLGSGLGMAIHDCLEPQFFSLHLLEP